MNKLIQNNVMPLTLKIRKIGNSLMITVPQTLAKLCGISDDDEFIVDVTPEYLILKTKRKI